MKIDDYPLPKSVPQNLQYMLEDIRNLLNQGKYQHENITSVPTLSELEDGSMKLYKSGATSEVYYRTAGVLYKITGTAV